LAATAASGSTPAAPPPTTATGVPAPLAFQPFWVENFVVTPIWSGSDASAVDFGNQPPFFSFLVVQAQAASRLYVFNPRSNNYGYVDAADVGPSGPPVP